MPYKFRRISQTKVNKILKCFASDISAAQTAKIVGVNRNTANDWFNFFRKEILKFQEKENGSFQGEVELDESYFTRAFAHNQKISRQEQPPHLYGQMDIV